MTQFELYIHFVHLVEVIVQLARIQEKHFSFYPEDKYYLNKAFIIAY